MTIYSQQVANMVLGRYTIEWDQGVVVRQNGNLAADFADGKWVWLNPELSIPDEDLKQLSIVCAHFERSMLTTKP